MERTLVTNRRAAHDYHIEERYEAGIELTGPEVKSIRAGRANLRGSYARIVNGEVWLEGMHVSPYDQASTHVAYDPERPRRLLLHRREIRRLIGKVQERGYTLIPLRLYTKGRWIKVELGLARGKKQYDKREAIKRRDLEREMARERNR